MNLGALLLSLPSGAILLLIVAVAVVRRKAGLVERLFALLLLSQAAWLLFYSFELTAPTDDIALFFEALVLITLAHIAVFWLFFVLAYTGRQNWLRRRYVLAALIVPVVTTVLTLTNSAHGLIWQSFAVTQPGLVRFVTVVPGLWHIVHAGYSYLLAVLGALLLINFIRQAYAAYRMQSILLLAAWALPNVVAVVLSFWGDRSAPRANPTAFAMAAASILLAWDVFILHFLDLVPFARDFIVGSLQDGVIVLDSQGRIVDLNAAALRMVPRLSQHSVGQPLFTILADYPELVQRFGPARQAHAELNVGTPDRPQYYDLSISSLEDQTGRYTGRIIMLREVTARIQAEEELRKLSRAVEQSHNIIIITNTHGIIEYVNPKFTEVTGYTTAEVLGQHTRLLKSGESSEDTYKRLWGTITEGGDWRGEFHNRRKDGSLYWVSALISPVTNAQGQVTHFLAIQEDITRRKAIEAAERQQRQLAEALADLAANINRSLALDEVLDQVLAYIHPVVEVAFDVAQIMLIEDGVARIVGFYMQDPRPELTEGLLAARFPIRTTRNLREVYETAQPLVIADTQRYEGWVDSGVDLAPRSLLCVPIRLNDAVIGFLNLDSKTPDAFDLAYISQLQAFADQAAIAIRNAQLFEKIQENAHSLEARNHELDAFSHTVAHDLRAPLNLVLGYLSLAEIEVEPESALGGYLREVQDGALKMNEMIESLLMLAQLRDTEEALATVDMNEVAAAALRRYRSDIDKRRVSVQVEGTLPAARANAAWMEEVLANLISNAIKYIGQTNPDPQITIAGFVQEGRARYEVRDNGVGIQPEDQAQLFEMFSRMHMDEAEGFGLGLSIVLRILRRLNGQVGVQSQPGVGSTFWFTLPLAEDDMLARDYAPAEQDALMIDVHRQAASESQPTHKGHSSGDPIEEG